MILKPNMRVLFQGDSVTDFGRDYDNEKDLGYGYPIFIKNAFNRTDVEFINKGVSGERISDVYNRRERDIFAINPDIFSFLIGVNDHDFILSLPNGYDTLVGERGANLSGGERQRIAIARAILKNAPFLILDEATASVDAENERDIQLSLEKLMENKTSLVIAHRLSTIQNADKIYVLHQHKICEQGKHHILLKENGIYTKLVSAQNLKEEKHE